MLKIKEYPVMLSVYCVTYNHEKYISQALDGILMQKTQYSFEVLIGDDLSNDRTRDILKSYETKYPNRFQVFYRNHNMNNEEITNSVDLSRRCRGKYVMILEGDDYWTDENKIEMQINFLEANPDYIAVAHNCVVVGHDSQPLDEFYPECKDEDYTIGHYACGILPGQSATVMYRNYVVDDMFDPSFIDLNISPGDRKKIFTFAANGKVHCIQKVMSAYRHVTTFGNSYSATVKYCKELQDKWLKAQLDYAYKIDKRNAIICAELLYLAFIRYSLLNKRFTLGESLRLIGVMKNKARAFIWLARRDFSKRLLKKSIKLL
jgi:glycosyltransferase involved in cell wall biosynthesis